MKNTIKCIALAVAICSTGHASAQALTTRTGEGGSVKVDLGYNVVLNKASSLTRQWVYIQDPKCPVDIEGSTDVHVRYKKDYNYQASMIFKAKQDVTAVEVIHVITDVFGRRLSTLQNATVRDVKAGDTGVTDGEWRIWSETEASHAFTSFTYVRSVRTADGKVYFAPMAQVLEVIRKGAPSLTSTDIEPKKAEAK